MILSKTEQKRMLKDTFNEYDSAKILGHFEGWECVINFDRHSPCENLMFVTPIGTEIKVFMPNSTQQCVDEEQFNTICVWFGDDGFPEDFDNEEVLIDYLIEQEINDNV